MRSDAGEGICGRMSLVRWAVIAGFWYVGETAQHKDSVVVTCLLMPPTPLHKQYTRQKELCAVVVFMADCLFYCLTCPIDCSIVCEASTHFPRHTCRHFLYKDSIKDI